MFIHQAEFVIPLEKIFNNTKGSKYQIKLKYNFQQNFIMKCIPLFLI
jgi:hypothetical protein